MNRSVLIMALLHSQYTTSAPTDLQFVRAKQMVGIHNVHKSIYCGHLCNNTSREASLCSGTAQTEMGTVAALRELLIGEEEKGRWGVPRWERAALPLAMTKHSAAGQEVKVSHSPLP